MLTNGNGDRVSLNTATDDIHSPGWWPDTSYLVHSLSKGDFSALENAVRMIGSEHEPVFASSRETVSGELYARLEHFGYMAVDDDALPAEWQGHLTMRGFTGYGKEHIAAFVVSQRMQMEEFGGDRMPLQTFCSKFSDLHDHHSRLPLEVLHTLRVFFSDQRYDFEAEHANNLFELYRILGIVKYTDEGLIHPTRFGAMNVPFLFDLILHERGATVRH